MKYIFALTFLVSIALTANSQCNGSEPVIDFGPDTVLCQGQTLGLNAPSGFNFYQWSTGTTGPNITVTTDGTYSVNAGLIGSTIILHGDFQGGTTTAANNFTTLMVLEREVLMDFYLQKVNTPFQLRHPWCTTTLVFVVTIPLALETC
jgi:hypothetical protein